MSYEWEKRGNRIKYWFWNILSVFFLVIGLYLILTFATTFSKTEIIYSAFLGLLILFFLIASAVYTAIANYYKMYDMLEKVIDKEGMETRKSKSDEVLRRIKGK